MSKMIQIRDVPDALHRTLKIRAVQSGTNLSDYIKKELERIAARPTLAEWLEETRRAAPISSSKSGAQLIRELRDSR